MKRLSRHWLWLLLLVPIGLGLLRLRFDAEMLDLLPADSQAVQGLKLYQQHFSNARELIIAVRAPNAEIGEATSHSIAERLRAETNLISEVTWQPPWLEHPAQAAELIAYLWLNQPPEMFAQLAERLTPTNLPAILAASREQLATSMSPGEIAQLSYDPFGLTRLPQSAASSAPGFGQGQEMFISADGTFRIIFAKANRDLKTYRDCIDWLAIVKQTVNAVIPAAQQTSDGVSISYTGRPVFVAEISSSMKHDVTTSVGGTSLIIAILFWIAHRRVKPMLWLLTLLALILAGTLALGGLIFGTINVISMGFAAILLGLAVDYAVVHYQEALAHPDLCVPEIRRAIAPSIFWAAVTTITAFIVLNFGGLPGLGQLGSLVGLGVALSAFVMIFAFLPPLFPNRRQPSQNISPVSSAEPTPPPPINPIRVALIFGCTIVLIAGSLVVLCFGLPKMDGTSNALRPRHSEAYETLDTIKQNLIRQREPIWLLVAGRNETEVGRRLDEVEPALQLAVSNHTIEKFTLPTPLWPRPEFQPANRATALEVSAGRNALLASALAGGFTEDSFGLTENILATWQRAALVTNTFWPTNQMSSWLFEKFVARTGTNLFALGLLYLPTNSTAANVDSIFQLAATLPHNGVWISGWELLGNSILSNVRANMWKLVLPMVGLVLLSLWLAFHRGAEVFLSVSILLISGLCLLAIMHMAGWSWNLLSLMALPLILGTGVDYSIFMQLALRRHHGDLKIAHRSVGRALLLCGATAVSGFGMLGFSSNAGMASFGQVCATGVACNMLISVFLLPVWWRTLVRRGARGTGHEETDKPATPSSLYSSTLWRCALTLTKILPAGFIRWLAVKFAVLYWTFVSHRREIVIENLLPVLNNDRTAATKCGKELFKNFVLKLVELWRYESGQSIDDLLGTRGNWEVFQDAQSKKRGVLIVTPHLGNWEFGAPLLTRRGVPLHVVTLVEPSRGLTELRKASRAKWGIDTLVIGEDPFAAVEIIRRLEAGATVALLVDRPPENSAVTVELFGRPFRASLAMAELARASGAVILPAVLVRQHGGYSAQFLPVIDYNRPSLRDREARRKLTQEILRAFEPSIRQNADQWYHFVPIWPAG